MKNYNFPVLTILLLLSFFDFFSILLILFFYLTNINFLFLVNLNFSFMFLLLLAHFVYARKINSGFGLCIFILLLVSSLKLIICSEQSSGNFRLYVNYFYGILMPFLAINYSLSFKSGDYDKVISYFEKFAKCSLFFSVFGIIVYFSLYSLGYVHYFGLSVNLHYIYPFFLRSKIFLNTMIFMILILLTGKRAILVNFLAEMLGYFSHAIKRRPLMFSTMLVLFLLALILVYKFTSLLDRYDVYFRLDFHDSYITRIAFSGRFEEIVGIYNYFIHHPIQCFFGAPPGATYTWDLSTEVYSKNYAHLTFLSYVFRYGLIFALLLYGFFIYVLKKYWNSSSPFCLIFLGIFVGSFFGSNLSVDSYPWLILGFLIRFKNQGYFMKNYR